MVVVGTALTLAVAGISPAAVPDASPACITMNTERMPLTARRSTLDSLTFEVGGGLVKICYSRPSARGRTMIGGAAVPFGRLWRTGANEPTMIHTPVALNVAGIMLEPGSYSLYTVPGEATWEIIVNRSVSQWGHESRYSDEVKAQEVGRGSASSSRTEEHVETLTIRSEPSNDAVNVLLEWEYTRVTIPVRAG